MVTCHRCNIYGTWRSKTIGGDFKVIIWVGKPQMGPFFMNGIGPFRHHECKYFDAYYHLKMSPE